MRGVVHGRKPSRRQFKRRTLLRALAFAAVTYGYNLISHFAIHHRPVLIFFCRGAADANKIRVAGGKAVYIVPQYPCLIVAYYYFNAIFFFERKKLGVVGVM